MTDEQHPIDERMEAGPTDGRIRFDLRNTTTGEDLGTFATLDDAHGAVTDVIGPDDEWVIVQFGPRAGEEATVGHGQGPLDPDPES